MIDQQSYSNMNEPKNNKQALPPIQSLLCSYPKDDALDIACCDKQTQKKKKSRCNLPKHVTNILNEWLSDHLDNPYPTASEKKELIEKTNLSSVQLSNWFINVRRRKLFSQYYDLKDKPISRSSSITKQRNTEDKDKQLELEYMHTKKRMSLQNILNVCSPEDEPCTTENTNDCKKNNYTSKNKSTSTPRIIMEADEIKLEEKFNFQPFTKRKKLMDRLYDLKKIYYVNDGDCTGEQP
ncbi:Cup9 protein [Hanseniaspora uvarum]|nr:Cup9 protein [Hanseniaspora uvarum]